MEDGGKQPICLAGFLLLPSTAAPRRSTFPPLFLCGPELRVIPKQSALIQGAGGAVVVLVGGAGAQRCQRTLTPGLR